MKEAKLRIALREALQTWSNKKDHWFDCIGYSEGQFCCLDPEHKDFDTVLELLIAAIKKSQK